MMQESRCGTARLGYSFDVDEGMQRRVGSGDARGNIACAIAECVHIASEPMFGTICPHRVCVEVTHICNMEMDQVSPRDACGIGG